MLRSIKLGLFCLLLFVGITSCEKEISEENGGSQLTGGSQSGTADFDLDGSVIPCTAPTISGNYIVGTPLGLADSVVITLNVNSLGTYVISTAFINGISFAGSGTFTGTGAQSVTLYGSGTPLAAGSNIYVPGTSGCPFVITAVVGTIIPPVGFLYYEATIDTVVYREEVNGTSQYEAGYIVVGDDSVDLASLITPVIDPRPLNTTSFQLNKSKLRNYTTALNADFRAFFAPNPYPYVASGGDGISIVWGDKLGNDWTTYGGTGDQTGSTFTITNVEDEPGQTEYAVRVTAVFNCKLYNSAGDSTITLTNGKYVGVFGKL